MAAGWGAVHLDAAHFADVRGGGSEGVMRGLDVDRWSWKGVEESLRAAFWRG